MVFYNISMYTVQSDVFLRYRYVIHERKVGGMDRIVGKFFRINKAGFSLTVQGRERRHATSLEQNYSDSSFYPSLCIFISSFLSDHSIAAVVDGHCSLSVNSGVPQGSVLSPTLSLCYSSMI